VCGSAVCHGEVGQLCVMVRWVSCVSSQATRVMWTPPLRESWAMPFLILQLLALTGCIRLDLNALSPLFIPQSLGLRQRRPSLLQYSLLTTVSLAFLLPWQFSQFVLVTQTFSLLTLHSLRLIPSTTLCGIFLSLASALVGNIVLQFFNSLLLFSLLPSSLLSCLVSVHHHFPPYLPPSPLYTYRWCSIARNCMMLFLGKLSVWLVFLPLSALALCPIVLALCPIMLSVSYCSSTALLC
jgi:hypothetical protein